MRVNLYEQELTDEVEIVSVKSTTPGVPYYGVRLLMESSDKLHDGDRSSVTFWLGTPAKATGYFANVLNELHKQAPLEP